MLTALNLSILPDHVSEAQDSGDDTDSWSVSDSNTMIATALRIMTTPVKLIPRHFWTQTPVLCSSCSCGTDCSGRSLTTPASMTPLHLSLYVSPPTPV